MKFGDSLGTLLKRIDQSLHNRANQTLKENGVTFAQMELLLALHEHGNRLSMKELEERLYVSQPTTVGLVQRLEEKGLIETSFSEKDKRKKSVCITDKGMQILRSARQSIEECETQLKSGMTDDEVEQLKTLLKKACRNLMEGESVNGKT